MNSNPAFCLCLLIILGCLSVPACATEQIPATINCQKDDPHCDVVNALGDAMAEEIKAFTAQMNYLTSADSKEWLRGSESQWGSYSTETCSYESSGKKDVSATFINLCMTRLIKERTAQLRSYLNCRESGCPN